MFSFLVRKFLRKILKIIWVARRKMASTAYLDPKELLTSNRKDLYYGQLFLKDVLERKKTPRETLYYYFASDSDGEWVRTYGNRKLAYSVRDKNTESKDFIKLYKDIKENGIKDPLIVRKYKSEFIKIVYILKGKRYWRNIKNETNYQSVAGNHRLTIALYLDYKKIPVKILTPWFSFPPDHTSFITIKEKEYLDKINKIKTSNNL